MYGGENSDIMIGGEGSDLMYGDGGHDKLIAGTINFNPNQQGYGPVDIVNDTEDDDDDYLFGGTGNDTFVIADYGFWNIGEDKLMDKSSGETVVYMDPWGWDATGVPYLGNHGHLPV